uniref:NAD kinase 2, mitochondrial n=1 Tax=Elaeophora elaphi TaxID=1147741 RepID=A0A0R3RX77_9BILA
MKRIMLKFSVNYSSLLAHTVAIPFFASSMDNTVVTCQSICKAATKVQTSNYSTTAEKKCVFKPKKILILSKLTRLEYERRTHPLLDEIQLKKALTRRGSNYERLRRRHDEHYQFLNVVISELRACGVETRTVQRFDYNDAAISWADAVFSAGGDGTFLHAASRISSTEKPVIGINTDPKGSEGYLCLLKKLSHEYFRDALKRLLAGDFRWLYRQRIRIRLEGDVGDIEPFYLHEEQLSFQNSRKQYDLSATDFLINPHLREILKSERKSKSIAEGHVNILPDPALNDVFIGESLSSRVSYYEIQCDDGEMVKQKSSGVLVCTGSGSTSWYFNMNKMTEHCVSGILDIASKEIGISTLRENKSLIRRIRDTYNSRLLFAPDSGNMAYCVRNPIYNSTYPEFPPRGLVKRLRLHSRCYDAHLVIDGRVAYKFNDGAEAVLEIHPEDALKTVVFR